MNRGTELLLKGERYEKIGKILLYVFLGGIGLLILVMIGIALSGAPEYIPLYLALGVYSSSYEFVRFLVILAYLAVVVGSFWVPFFFMGPVYQGLGKIVDNTEKK